MAKRNPAAVILACRNVVAGNEAAKAIMANTGHSNVKCMLLDLASLESVRYFAQELIKEHPTVDVLVANAGVWVPMDQRSKTSDGFEIHYGVNHLGHFLLFNLLKDSGLTRVVVVSSGLMHSGKVDLETLDWHNGRYLDKPKGTKFAPTGYCDSKLMNVLFAKELVNRFPHIEAMSVCPGWCKTDLARHVYIPFYKKILFIPAAFMFMRSAYQGAQNLLFGVLVDGQNFKNGGFYRDGHLAFKDDKKADKKDEVGSKLWDVSAGLVNL